MFDWLENTISASGKFLGDTWDKIDNSNALKYASNLGGTWLEGKLANEKAEIEKEVNLAKAQATQNASISISNTVLIIGGLVVLVLILK